MSVVLIGCLLGCAVMVGLGDARPLDDAVGPFAAEFPQAARASIATIAQPRIFTLVENAGLRPELRRRAD